MESVEKTEKMEDLGIIYPIICKHKKNLYRECFLMFAYIF